MAHDFSVIGRPLPRVDGLAKSTGQTKFADDLLLPRMLFGRMLRSVHAHARILRVDPSRALALPGVCAVITGQDLPVKYGILPVSQDETALAVDRVRFVGDPVAAVAAVDEETAERALELIEVEYEPLPAIMTIEEALARDEVRIHDYGDGPANVHKMVALEFGDVEAGFREAHHIREDVFFYEGSTHLPMEQHAAVAFYEADGRLTVWSSTQTPHYVHRALAKVLEYPAGRIRVIATPVGGGFGGKSDPFAHEIVAAKLSMVTGRPVKITCTREEVFYFHRGRHPVLMRVRTGFTPDGRITAMHFSPSSMAVPTARTAWRAPTIPVRCRRPPTRSRTIGSRGYASSPTSRRAGPSAGTARRSRALRWSATWTRRRQIWGSTPWSCAGATWSPRTP